MTIFTSRDYLPAASGYLVNTQFSPLMYQLSVFLYRVLGYSVIGATSWNLDTTVKTLTVTNATNTTPIQITTSIPHGFIDQSQSVIITGVVGNTAANNIGSTNAWSIIVTGPNTFTLTGSTGNGLYTSGGIVSAGFLYTSGLVSDGYGAGINFGGGFEKEVSIPVSKRTVVVGDIGRMLVLKSTKYPTKNNGCFKISGINAGANRYIIDYRSTENPPVETANSIDWWLYENEATVSNHILLFNTDATNISAATNATPIQITAGSSYTYGLLTGQQVLVSGVNGNTAANGIWTITQTGASSYTLNGSVGNGVFTSGGTIRVNGYPGDGASFNNRIILQSPHSSGWQVRIAIEAFSSYFPLMSITTGFEGNSFGDFPVGSPQTHVAESLDVNTLYNSEYRSLIVGGVRPGTTSRVSIFADGYGQSVFLYARSTGGFANGIFVFGIPDNEPLPLAPDTERTFTYGGTGNVSAGSFDFGGIIPKTGINNNIGVAIGNGSMKLAALASWGNLDGSATTPIYSSNAGDTPFSATTEILPIEIWSGINCDISATGNPNTPFFFDPKFMGTTPFTKIGRSNFGAFTLSTEEVTTRTITNATNAIPIQITTSTANALVTGQTVTISGVNGNTAANGTWKITVINNTNFTIDNSSGNGTYISGGTANGCPRWLHLQNGMYVVWNSASGITP